MCCSLFLHLLATGGPEQKTIIFCASDSHADNISTGMNNLYAPVVRQRGTDTRPALRL